MFIRINKIQENNTCHFNINIDPVNVIFGRIGAILIRHEKKLISIAYKD